MHRARWATLMLTATALAAGASPGRARAGETGGAEGAALVSPIPADAAIIFCSGRSGEKDPWGFASRELYTTTLDGVVTRITHSRYVHNHFSVSPDRTKIAANRYSRGDTSGDGTLFPMDDWKELWILDVAAGTERRILPEVDAGFGGLAWSPDSRAVYFSSFTGGRKDHFDIYRVGIDDERVERITDGLNALLGIDAPRKFASDVDVSPDGRWLVFLYTPQEMIGVPERKTRIAAMRVDGSEARFLTDGGPLPPQRRGVWPVGDFDPDFSPDGTAVAFARVTEVGFTTPSLSTFDLMTVPLAGGGPTRISPEGNDATHGIPSWGEDGRILFTEWSRKRGTAPIVFDPVTGESLRVPLAGEASHSQWIPSGGAPR